MTTIPVNKRSSFIIPKKETLPKILSLPKVKPTILSPPPSSKFDLSKLIISNKQNQQVEDIEEFEDSAKQQIDSNKQTQQVEPIEESEDEVITSDTEQQQQVEPIEESEEVITSDTEPQQVEPVEESEEVITEPQQEQQQVEPVDESEKVITEPQQEQLPLQPEVQEVVQQQEEQPDIFQQQEMFPQEEQQDVYQQQQEEPDIFQQQEVKFVVDFNVLTDDQMNLIGFYKGYADVLNQNRENKMMILGSNIKELPDEDSDNIGDLIILCVYRNIPIGEIPIEHVNNFLLKSCLLLSKVYPTWNIGDGIEESKDLSTILYLMTDEQLYVILRLFNFGSNNIMVSVLTKEEKLETLKTGKYPVMNSNLVNRIRRYESISIIPDIYIIPLSFTIPIDRLSLNKSNQRIYSLLSKLKENRCEYLFAHDRQWNTQKVKKLGVLPPNDHVSVDYFCKNYNDYPSNNPLEKLNKSKVENMKSRNTIYEYLSKYNDFDLFNILNVIPGYHSRKHLISQLSDFFSGKNIFYVDYKKDFVYYGNKNGTNKFSSKEIINRINDSSFNSDDLRNLQRLLISSEMMLPPVNKTLSKKIIEEENLITGLKELIDLNSLSLHNIGVIRRGLQQLMMYGLTGNKIYKNVVEINLLLDYTNHFSKKSLKEAILTQDYHDIVNFSVLYLDLFFDYFENIRME